MSRDLYSEVTARILADMVAGAMPWEKSWNGTNRAAFGIPSNATTRRPYRGINVLLLWARSMALGVADMRYLTFKQALDAGGSVRKGEHGAKIYFYKPLAIKGEDGADDRTIPLLREYTVFHVSQCDGCNFAELGNELPAMPEDCAEFVQAIGANLTHGGDKACYIPSADRVLLPFPQDFKGMDEYRSTLYHELTHWTGAPKRMNRDIRNRFGSQDYAKEELIAELGAAFLCAEFGVPYMTQHRDYLANWCKRLGDDKRFIFQAASAAQKAVDWMRAEITGAEAIAEAA